MNKRLDFSEWEDVKLYRTIKMKITDEELEKCHKRVCPNLSHMDFIMSYREATECSEVKGKNASIELLTVLMKYPSWKPLLVSIVNF